VEEEKMALRYPIFKPVSLPDFQIGNDSCACFGGYWLPLRLFSSFGSSSYGLYLKHLNDRKTLPQSQKFADFGLSRQPPAESLLARKSRAP
jgi:hypothetical protein